MKNSLAQQEARVENIYRRVPIGKAIPFGLQHVLAMFVANVTPLIVIASVAVYNGQPFSGIETARLLQNCMIIAGIGTMLQLYPIWKIGSGLPVVMGISFTFLAAAMSTASQDYGIMVGHHADPLRLRGCRHRIEHPQRWRLLLWLLIRLPAGFLAESAGGSHHTGSNADFPHDHEGRGETALCSDGHSRWLYCVHLFRHGGFWRYGRHN